MGAATGTSIKGTQLLLFETDVNLTNYAIWVSGVPLEQGEYKGYVSLELFNGVNSFQWTGRSLWYEGVLLLQNSGLALQVGVVATWRKAGITWTVNSF